MEQSHRQQKKEQTRRALIESAYQLFGEKGYDSTTLADITQRANCAPRTFFRYFSSKEDLLLIRIDALWNDLKKRMETRPPQDTTLAVLTVWSNDVIDEYQRDPGSFLRVLDRDIEEVSMSTAARQKLYSMERMRSILSVEFAKDLNMSPADTTPQLIASAAAAMFDVYHRDAALSQTDPRQAVIDTATILEGALAAARSYKNA